MPYVNILVNVPNEQLQTLNDQIQFPTKVYESIQGCINLLLQVEAGTTAASVQVTTLNSSISVSTDGGKSEQATYSHL
jgi:hypothetical protein